MARILVVEDSADVHALLVETLEGAGHHVLSAHDGLEARRLLTADAPTPGPGSDGDGAPELVVLDLMLPHVDGSVLLAELRRRSQVPVLVLSAKDAVYTKVDLLRLGADDYVTKPFDLVELTARIEALLRRAAPAATEPGPLVHGPLELDPARALASLDGAPVSLTATELRLLQLLLESPGQVFSRPRIYEAVWQEPCVGADAAVKTPVSNRRAKLREAAPALDPIETVWGLGYRLRALPSA